MIRRMFLTLAVTLVAMPLNAHDKWRDGEFRGAVILTITGNIALPTRGESDEEIDKFFSYNDLTFDSAAQFDAAALAALTQESIEVDFPKDGHIGDFSGPLMSDVLRAAGATGDLVTFRALDGYAIEIPMAELIEKGAILALKLDGIPFGIGDFGPTQLVFPRLDRDELADMNDDWWVYSIYHIHVE